MNIFTKDALNTAGTNQLCPIENDMISNRLSYGPISLHRTLHFEQNIFFKHSINQRILKKYIYILVTIFNIDNKNFLFYLQQISILE